MCCLPSRWHGGSRAPDHDQLPAPGRRRDPFAAALVAAVKPLISRAIFDPDRGARTTLYLALSPEVAGVSGGYFDEYQRQVAPAAAADDRALQEALWLASERWTRAGAEPGRAEVAAALPGSMRSV